MALIADIRVNHKLIGRMVCVRKECVDDQPLTYRYECSAILEPHPNGGKGIETPIVSVEHPYDESAFALMSRAIDGMGLA